jgi:hypothetical protein
MLWYKKKYSVSLHGGKGSFSTDGMHGILQQLIVTPQKPETVWSMEIKDSDGDKIFEIKDVQGRLDAIDGIPLGQSQPEKLSVLIYDSTSNEQFNVIFKVREVR